MTGKRKLAALSAVMILLNMLTDGAYASERRATIPIVRKPGISVSAEQITFETKSVAQSIGKGKIVADKNAYMPENYKKITIIGPSSASKYQARKFIEQNNPSAKLNCSIEELVDYYWAEAERENIRGDIALAQAIVETGFFRFGGDVKPKQNNFCGLGTTGGGVKGAKFKNAELGVRAHIQHLMAYAVKKKPSTEIIDPRYELAHAIRLERGLCETWYKLNGTWAMSSNYCEKIMRVYQKMLLVEDKEKDKRDREEAKAQKELKQKKKRYIKVDKEEIKQAVAASKETVAERVAEILREEDD